MLIWTFVIGLFEMPELDIVWIRVFMNILLNFLKPARKITVSV